MTLSLHDTAEVTRLVTRGARRHLVALGYATVLEASLRDGRRADILAIDDKGTVAIVEVKASVADFRADAKWPDYLGWCDLFFFAVPETFPVELIPGEVGLLVADGYDAAVLRPAPQRPLAGARRKSMLLRFAGLAGARLMRHEDPGI